MTKGCQTAGGLAALLLVGLIVSCGQSEAPVPPPRPIPDDSLLEPPETPEPPQLTTAALNTVEELRSIATRGMLRPLSRRAEREPDFTSNFGGDRHFAHWDLMRRIGVDPNAKLLEVLDEPHAAAQVGDEVWFIWPDLAALKPDELLPEKLSFRDRARLLTLVGEEGVQAVRDGNGYPGFRTAISEDGQWLYFVHEPTQ